MRNLDIKMLSKRGATGNTIIVIASIILIYLLISLYFTNHFFVRTVINGANVSLRAHDDVDTIMRSHVKNYVLHLTERNGETEEITGQDIGMEYNEKNNVAEIYHMQNSLKWISPVFSTQNYYVNNLFGYNKKALENKIEKLFCLNRGMIEPRNVSFQYSNGSYEVIEEVYGNKIIKDMLRKAIKSSILKGERKLDLNEKLCYENPKYTISSDKTYKTRDLLNKYVSANITYKFDGKSETVDGNIINEWIGVDENLEVIISKTAVIKYVNGLSKKYDTVGAARNFKTSMGKIIEVKGGLYGWKINREAETKALLENISLGKVLEKEPVYTQKALSREDEIGDTYVEINLTRQHLWFYKDGKLITQGPVVTGNPNRGNSTVVGTYMLNYKQKDATLKGPSYSVKVNYWMPFYGNIGIHDAGWRHSFGGEIYKRNGTHGCINAPLYLAKAIFESIEADVPIICYEE